MKLLLTAIFLASAAFSVAHAGETNTYGGVGMVIATENGQVVVEKVYTNTPASRAQLEKGDIILTVDGKSTENAGLLDIVNLLRGEAGSRTQISVRKTDRSVETINLTRRSIRAVFPGEPVDGSTYLEKLQLTCVEPAD
jgi:carboxyl-terminal processing protease